MTPALFTATIDVSLDDHVIVSDCTGCPALFIAIAAAFAAVPTSRLATGSLTSTVATLPVATGVGGLDAPGAVGSLRSTHAANENRSAARNIGRTLLIGARIETLRVESVRRLDWRDAPGEVRCSLVALRHRLSPALPLSRARAQAM